MDDLMTPQTGDEATSDEAPSEAFEPVQGEEAPKAAKTALDEDIDTLFDVE
jgi:hypothetical protein